ncbi:hypothetical protein [Actinotalea caeni]|uniref:hypothetical protein n=1 Tax=Actinotalea caeni TaxID=1348467 RepID=UPI0012E10DD2|nr:hypothetical protein [Actinotalea caeni]
MREPAGTRATNGLLGVVDELDGGTGGERGRSHMWRPGEPDPTPADGKGGTHRRAPRHRAG